MRTGRSAAGDRGWKLATDGYTYLDAGRRYLYESRAGDFRRELEIDRDGLVVAYPDSWQRG